MPAINILHRFLVDDRRFVAYYGAMTHEETDIPQTDPLTIGELISLQDAAKYAGLEKKTLHNYARSGRLRAKRLGPIWVTTRAAVDEYLQSRSFENIPIKYRKMLDK
jgi:excisionase family DNA binding protein